MPNVLKLLKGYVNVLNKDVLNETASLLSTKNRFPMDG